MRIYEELFIVKPDAPEEEVDAYITTLRDLITASGGAVEKEEKWGKRKLAYKISKYSEGFYVLLLFTATPETIHELERRMRVTDMVFKFITVRRDIRLKKVNKRKKHREARAARKPPPPAAPPSMPTGEGHGAPGAPGAHAAPAMPAAPAAPAAPAEPVAVAAAVTEPAEGTGE